jgi:hypothetical protein
MEQKFARDNIQNLTAGDMTDAVYGAIQSMIEQGRPKNVEFHYFLPAIPFGPELATFMDIGPQAQPLDNVDAQGVTRFTGNDLVRSAVNFARIADLIPTVGGVLTSTSTDEDLVVDLNSLIASGRTVSSVYESVLTNCQVVNNGLTPADAERLRALRALLYTDPVPTTAAGEEPAPAVPEEIDLDALLSDGVDTSDLVADPAGLPEPTPLMKAYQAMEMAFHQVEQVEMERRQTITSDNPNAGDILGASEQKVQAARTRWDLQGHKNEVETIAAKIEMLSQGGMPGYVSELRRRYAANQVRAAVFATEDGVGGLIESGQYAALRPNNILRATSGMKIELESSSSDRWSSMSTRSSQASGRFGVPFISPGFRASASAKKTSSDAERSFFSQAFSISFQIVQGIIDRPWLDLAFLESKAYTTVDPATKQPLDQVSEIVELSDGKTPPTGALPLVPMTVYFVRDLVVTSQAFKSVAQSELDEFSGKAGASIFSFGASGERTTKTTSMNTSSARTEGEIRLDGLFLTAMASRYLGHAPNPDFEGHPSPGDWI